MNNAIIKSTVLITVLLTAMAGTAAAAGTTYNYATESYVDKKVGKLAKLVSEGFATLTEKITELEKRIETLESDTNRLDSQVSDHQHRIDRNSANIAANRDDIKTLNGTLHNHTHDDRYASKNHDHDDRYVQRGELDNKADRSDLDNYYTKDEADDRYVQDNGNYIIIRLPF